MFITFNFNLIINKFHFYNIFNYDKTNSLFVVILGIGDWGLGIGDWAQSPIPNPQSPIPNPQSPILF
jgi:hypothetical protein